MLTPRFPVPSRYWTILIRCYNAMLLGLAILPADSLMQKLASGRYLLKYKTMPAMERKLFASSGVKGCDVSLYCIETSHARLWVLAEPKHVSNASTPIFHPRGMRLRAWWIPWIGAPAASVSCGVTGTSSLAAFRTVALESLELHCSNGWLGNTSLCHFTLDVLIKESSITKLHITLTPSSGFSSPDILCFSAPSSVSSLAFAFPASASSGVHAWVHLEFWDPSAALLALQKVATETPTVHGHTSAWHDCSPTFDRKPWVTLVARSSCILLLMGTRPKKGALTCLDYLHLLCEEVIKRDCWDACFFWRKVPWVFVRALRATQLCR